ncbi:hypothetical protein E8E13_003766 [Curvularia kusanoi]|uniref:Uncharacterized protein n=1 Tax=Curvularia kusanoi TaxID=90978 RepID=A0A9P4TBG0_CURKU|nr:hypothetical protein E8E13_003766 [Curvularia kusanoi]
MSVIVRAARNLAANVGNGFEHAANRVLPPQQRERALENLRSFSVRNPRLASFLAAQTALAGLPILLFLAFAISTLFASLVTCVLLGVIAAFLFTFFITGFALFFLIPSVVVGSCAASIFFFWGLVGYMILQRINGGETPVNPGTDIGDKLNKLTGGRLRDLVDQADSDTQQESMALAPSQAETLHMDRRNEYGGGDTGAHLEKVEKHVKKSEGALPALHRDILVKERNIIQKLT